MINLARKKAAAWIAILAILLNTLAPAVSHAIAGKNGDTLHEICTAQGLVTRIAPDELRKDRQPGSHHPIAFEHCPYCAPHGASFAAPPPVPALLDSVDTTPPQASPQSVERPAIIAWRASFPRAPPSLA